MEPEVVIRAENISKQYRLGVINTRTFAQDISRWWHRLLHKPDPYHEVSLENNEGRKTGPEYLWALKDINFEVRHGDVLGIIGKNGAGKSTLLKILSQITQPTTGEIYVKGRIVSLLEVGTGFHPDLTGRENVFMNGTILGMKKAEIKNKFDEIVDFAGVEKFIDTPVKRYSSGMYVRLAFSVAAHLEPEILILDEVLSVGDAEFQKKCLKKMEKLSRDDGRTVLFVSHSMPSVQNLCKKSILLSKGRVEAIGETENIISKYLPVKKTKEVLLSEIKDRQGNGLLRFQHGVIRATGSKIENSVEAFSDIEIELTYDTQELPEIESSKIDIGLNNSSDQRISWLSTSVLGHKIDFNRKKLNFIIRNLPLTPGDYNCNLYCEINNVAADWLTEVLKFQVVEKDYYSTGKTVSSGQGNILLNYTIRE